MTWDKIGRDSLEAAKLLKEAGRFRSSVSRAYYAAHYVFTEFVTRNGFIPAPRRQTPSHLAQAGLVGRHAGTLSLREQRLLRQTLTRLYSRRIDADYDSRVRIDSSTALEAIRDVHTLFRLVEVTP
jgi:uncharacterized protein (UPF0332 family)